MSKFKKISQYLGVAVGVLGSSVLVQTAHGAADAGVLAAADDVATAMNENVIGILTAALPVVILPGLLVLGIFIVWKFGKRFVRG